MSNTTGRQSPTFAFVIASYIYVCQALPLTWGKAFSRDMINHVWMVQYYADYLRAHWSFPGTYNTAETFGNPMPLFYGVFFYPLLSLFAVCTGADASVRLFAAMALVGPFISITMLVRSLTGSFSASLLVACVVNASVYQLTNLYFRGAVPEFFAIQFTLIGVSLLLYGMTATARRPAACIFLGVAAITLALGTHPLTAYSLGILVAPLVVLGLPALLRATSREKIVLAAAAALLAAGLLLPWFANVAMNRNYLQISMPSGLATLLYFPTSIDSLWGRIGYLYMDTRVVADGIAKTSTPFLDAPFSLPLAVVLVTVIGYAVTPLRWEKSLVLVSSVAVMAVLIYVSHPSAQIAKPGWLAGSVVATENDGFIYRLLLPLQFAYRLAGTWSVALSTALFLTLICVRNDSFVTRLSFRRILLMSSLLSAYAVSQKLYIADLEFRQFPAYRAAGPGPVEPTVYSIIMTREDFRRIVHDTDHYPLWYQSQVSYSTPGDLPDTAGGVTDGMAMTVSTWGEQRPISSDTPFLLRTNIVPAPTNRVTIDGTAPANMSLSAAGTLDFPLGPGTHNLTVEQAGKRFMLNQVAILLMLLWLIAASVALMLPSSLMIDQWRRWRGLARSSV